MSKGTLTLFKFSQRCKIFLIAFIEIIYEGFWLGVLNNKKLTEVTQSYFSSAQLYKKDGYNLSGFFDWEQKAINSFFFDCHNVLVGAAGGGREIIALHKLGKEVDAFECNPPLADDCRRLLDKEGITACVLASKPDYIPEEFGIYDGMIVGNGAYMHIIGVESRIRFLEQCRTHIKNGGPILLSFFINRENSGYRNIVLRFAKIIRTLLRNQDTLEFGDSLKYAGFCHLFSRQEIMDELNKAGFELVYFSEDEYPHAVGKAIK